MSDSDEDTVVDPHEERRKKELGTLLEKAIDLKTQSENGLNCVEEVTKVISACNAIVEEDFGAKSTNVAVLDVQVLQIGSCILRDTVHDMSYNMTEFKPAVYAEHILNYLNEEASTSETRWNRLEEEATQCFRSTPSYTYLLGALEKDERPAVLKPKVRQPRERFADAPVKRPTNVTSLQREETDMEERMNQMLPVLRNAFHQERKPIGYFRFVINPDSFAETIENIFHVSHMVKEGLVKLTFDEDSLPELSPVSKNQQNANSGRSSTQRQILIKMSIDYWEQLKDVFDIDTSMIPPRNLTSP